jgi:hypothetical protein
MAASVALSVIFLTEIAAWTIDLPEVRQFYFEKYSQHDNSMPELSDGQLFFDNINGDSLHNTERQKDQSVIEYLTQYHHLKSNNEYKKEQIQQPNIYANGFHHDIYMVKKVSISLFSILNYCSRAILEGKQRL